MLKFSLVFVFMGFLANAYGLGINDFSMSYRPTIEEKAKIEANEKQREEESTSNKIPLYLDAKAPENDNSKIAPVNEFLNNLGKEDGDTSRAKDEDIVVPLRAQVNCTPTSFTSSIDIKSHCVEPLRDSMLNIGSDNDDLIELLSKVHSENAGVIDSSVPGASKHFCTSCYNELLKEQTKKSEKETEILMQQLQDEVIHHLPNVAPIKFLAENRYGDIVRNLKSYYDNYKSIIDNQIIKRIRENNQSKRMTEEEIKEEFHQKLSTLQCLNFGRSFDQIKNLQNFYILKYEKAKDKNDKRDLVSLSQSCDKRSKSFISNLDKLHDKNVSDFKNLINEQLVENVELSYKSMNIANVNQQYNYTSKIFELGVIDINQVVEIPELTPIEYSEASTAIMDSEILRSLHSNQEKIRELCQNKKPYEEIASLFLNRNFKNQDELSELMTILIYQHQYLAPILSSSMGLCDYISSSNNLNTESYMKYAIGDPKKGNRKKILENFEKMSEHLCSDELMSAVGTLTCIPYAETNSDEYLERLQLLLNSNKISPERRLAISKLICEEKLHSEEILNSETEYDKTSGGHENNYLNGARIPVNDVDMRNRVANEAATGNAFLVDPDDYKKQRRERVKKALAQAASGLTAPNGVDAGSSMAKNESGLMADHEEDVSYTDALNSVADNFKNSQINNQKGLDQHLNNILDSDPEMKNEVTDLSDKLQEQLLPGEDSKKIMEEVLTGKRKLSADDLACSEPDEKKCKKTNQDLLDEIEKLKRQVAQKTEQEVKDKTSENEDLRAEIAALRKELDDFKKIPAASTSSKSSRSPASISASSSNELSGSNNLSSYETSRILTTPKSGLNPDRIGETPIDNNVTQMIPPTVTKDPTQFVEGNDFNLSTKNEGAGLYLSINQKGMKDYPVDIGKVVMDDNGKLQQIYLKNSETPIDITKLSKESLTALETFISKRQKDIPRVEREVGRKIATVESSIVENSTEIVRYQELLCSLNSSRQGCEN